MPNQRKKKNTSLFDCFRTLFGIQSRTLKDEDVETQEVTSPRLGLNVVHQSDHPQVDIVAVHGLGGHAYKTWTHQVTGKMWLRDFLPQQMPNARVMTFGYNANVINSKSVIGIMESAQNFLAELQSNRVLPEEKERSIIFVGHSLGGIVIKKALILAQQAQHYRPLLSATKGVMFFGVPHSGADGSGLAAVAVNIARVAVNVNSINLHDLDRYSRPLQDISQGFSYLEGFKIVTILESDVTTIALGQSLLVVPRSSAVLNYGNREVIFSIDGADHHTVCKFGTVEDIQYKKVWVHLKWLLDTPTHETVLIDSATSEKTRTRGKYFDIPYASSSNFTGRQEYLDKMSQAFSKLASRQCRLAIYGLPGAGKTQLAISFAESNRSKYDAVFFINASSEENLVRSFKVLHERLRLEKTVDEDKVEQVKRYFSDDANSNWLLIFDNADQLHTLNLLAYFPVANGHIIITTQDHRANDSDLAKITLYLEMFSPQESLSLLTSRARIETPTDDELLAAKRLSEQLGHHPLALDSAAAWVHHTGSSFRECLEAFPDRTTRLIEYRPSWASYKKTITDSLDRNFSVLQRENLQATTLFLSLAYLDNLNIPREMLRRGVTPQSRVGNDGEPFEQTPEQGCVDDTLLKLISNQFDFGKAIESLLSLSLIYQAKQDTGRIYSGFSLHPLIQSHARSQVKGREKELAIWRALSIVAQAFPSHFFWERFSNFKSSRISDFIDHSRIRFIILPHVRACCANLEPMIDDSGKNLMTMPTGPNNSRNEMGESNILQHAASLFLEAYYVEPNTFEGSWTSRFMRLVAFLIRETNDLHLQTLYLHNKRSLMYKEGQYRQAIALSESFLRESFPLVFDQSHRPSISSVSSEARLNAEVGYILIKHAELLVTEGATKTAFAESQRLLMLCRSVSLANPSLAERVMLSERDRILAKAYKDLGMWEASAKHFKDYCVDCLFPGTPHEGWATADWAQVLLELGQNEKAEEVIKGPLETRLSSDFAKISRLVTRANDTILLQINLAETRLRQGFHSEAEDRFQKCLERMLAFERLEHPEKTRVFSIYCGLARISHLNKDWNKAKTRWDTALNYGLTINLGSDNRPWDRKHFYQAVVLYSLADIHYELGNFDTAASLKREVIDSGSLLPENRMYWMLGLGTYWYREIEQKMQKRFETSSLGAN